MPRNAATATRPSRVIAYVVAYTLLVAVPAAAQTGYRVDPQGKDELWDVTSKMEMPGMPMGMPGMSMAMPAQTNRICAQAGSDEAGVPRKDECRVLESKRIGNKVSYRMACRNANDDYTATGESTWSGSGYQGRMQMVGKMQGEQMEMTMAYTGMRAGNCTLTTR